MRRVRKIIKGSIFAFLISMFLSSIIAIAENYEIIQLNSNWTVAGFLKYTDHNVFLAASLIISYYVLFRDLKQILPNSSFIFCFFFPFLLFYFLSNYKDYIYKYIVLLFIPFYSFSLFTEGGRMGQLTYLILFALLTIFLLKKYPISRFLIATIFLLTFSFVIYQTSTVVQNRFHPERVVNMIFENSNILCSKKILAKISSIHMYLEGKDS